MTVTLTAIQGWGTQVGSTVSSAATALESAAPSGTFAGVLAEVSAALEAGPGAPATASASSGGPGASSETTSATTEMATTPSTRSFSSLFALPGSFPGPAEELRGSGVVSGSDVVGEAERFLGTPYVWGGDGPTGFDCSGLVQYVYGQLGISLPRTSEEQASAGTAVPSLATAAPGDLVFFAGSDGTATAPGHVGIYLGDGMMIDAPYTGTDVQIQPVSAAGSPVAIRRIAGTVGAGSPGSLDGALGTLGAFGRAGAGAGQATSGAAVPATLAPLFAQAAGKYGVPETLLEAVARHESGFDTGAVSTAGAEGLMQIMPGTAAGLDVTPFTAGEAIDGAARLLSGYLDHFKSVPLALAAYNAGAGAVEEYGGVPPYGQTESYVQDIMATLGVSG